MNERANRDVRNRQRIPRANLGSRACHHCVANLEIQRCDNVALLAVYIKKQSESGCTIGVIFDGCHFGRNALFIALEIYNANEPTMPSTAMTNGDTAVRITTSTLAKRNEQGTFRCGFCDFLKSVASHPTCTGRYGFIFFYSHYCTPSKIGRVCPSAKVII